MIDEENSNKLIKNLQINKSQFLRRIKIQKEKLKLYHILNKYKLTHFEKIRDQVKKQPVISIPRIKLKGTHNVEKQIIDKRYNKKVKDPIPYLKRTKHLIHQIDFIKKMHLKHIHDRGDCNCKPLQELHHKKERKHFKKKSKPKVENNFSVHPENLISLVEKNVENIEMSEISSLGSSFEKHGMVNETEV